MTDCSEFDDDNLSIPPELDPNAEKVIDEVYDDLDIELNTGSS